MPLISVTATHIVYNVEYAIASVNNIYKLHVNPYTFIKARAGTNKHVINERNTKRNHKHISAGNHEFMFLKHDFLK